ncbi:hypothetical protein CEXT_25881 [Caerostris extrusa]|uniref:Prolactin receptor n=1 Tax=Caerostris extrusa TaxID=172846 RepID=A0AAV4PC79_CAEEX|nr:hypothetical protein CEXT_25881 [Caerostris extrusa]
MPENARNLNISDPPCQSAENVPDSRHRPLNGMPKELPGQKGNTVSMGRRMVGRQGTPACFAKSPAEESDECFSQNEPR